MKVYAICFNGKVEYDLIFSTKELAQKCLKMKREELFKRIVQFHDENENSFSYTFGWEEKGGTYSIKELLIHDTVS